MERYRNGKAGLLGFLVAQVMKEVGKGGGKANPKLVNVLLTEALDAPWVSVLRSRMLIG